MATWNNTNKSTAPVFTNTNKSGLILFGDLTISQIASMTFDDLFLGRPLGDWAFSDIISFVPWTNLSKS